MAQALGKPVLTVTVAFEIDEEEARALDALVDQSFYTILGNSYMQDHEQGLRRFLTTIREIVRPAILQADKARSLLHGKGGE